MIVTFVVTIGFIVSSTLALVYRSQRDDLASWIVYTHPEDFDEDEPPTSTTV